MLLEAEFKLQDKLKAERLSHKRNRHILKSKRDSNLNFDQCPICMGDKYTNGFLCYECSGRGYLVRQKVSLKPFSPRIENVAESHNLYRPSGSHAPCSCYGEHPSKTTGIQMVSPMQVPDTELEP